MATPNISFKYTNSNVNYELQQLLTHKLETLHKYLEETTLIEVEFRKEAPKMNGEVFVVEVNCTVKGEFYRATATKESFEKAIDEVRNELATELRRARQKRTNLLRKGARRIKSMVRLD